MALTNGCNHVAIVTEDLDRFVDFYTRVFEAEVVCELDEDGLRHALLDLGGGFLLHPFQVPGGNPHGRAVPAMFERGHLDHVALDVGDEEAFEGIRRRLVDVGASDGTVTDFGLVRSLGYSDPDGMQGEVAMTYLDRPARTFEQRGLEPLAPEPATSR